MRKYEKQLSKPVEHDVLVETSCDLCGAIAKNGDWEKSTYEVNEVEISGLVAKISSVERPRTGGCCPPPPCSADPFMEEVSDKIRRGEPVGIMEALAAIEYQSARQALPWWRKDALGWLIETFKGKPVKSAIRIICPRLAGWLNAMVRLLTPRQRKDIK